MITVTADNSRQLCERLSEFLAERTYSIFINDKNGAREYYSRHLEEGICLFQGEIYIGDSYGCHAIRFGDRVEFEDDMFKWEHNLIEGGEEYWMFQLEQ